MVSRKKRGRKIRVERVGRRRETNRKEVESGKERRIRGKKAAKEKRSECEMKGRREGEREEKQLESV